LGKRNLNADLSQELQFRQKKMDLKIHPDAFNLTTASIPYSLGRN